METEAADRSHCNSRLPFYPSSYSLLPCNRCGQWQWPFAEQSSRQSDLALIAVLSRFLGTLRRRVKRRPRRRRWEMGGHCVRFSIMTHRCRITLEIKSKTLNFNQATLMAWCKEWSLCLNWQAGSSAVKKGERELAQKVQVRQGDKTLIHQIAF